MHFVVTLKHGNNMCERSTAGSYFVMLLGVCRHYSNTVKLLINAGCQINAKIQ